MTLPLRGSTPDAAPDMASVPRGNSALVDRVNLTESGYDTKYHAMGYGGAVGEIGQASYVTDDGDPYLVFDGRDSIERMAESYKARMDGVEPSEWGASQDRWLDRVSESAIYDVADGERKDALVDRTKAELRQLINQGIINADETETAEAFQEAIEQFREVREEAGTRATDYSADYGKFKRGSIAAARKVKNVFAAPGTAAAHLMAKYQTRQMLADPEKLGKRRKVVKALSFVAMFGYFAYRVGKGFGADHFVEGFLPGGGTGMAATGGAHFETNLDDVTSKPSGSPSAIESAATSASPSASASPSTVTGGEGSTGGTTDPVTDPGLTDGDLGEGNKTKPNGFDSKLGKYEHDGTGKYGETTWKGTLEWKVQEMAEQQGIKLGDGDAGKVTHRLQEMLNISENKSRHLSDDYHLKLTQDQVDKIFDGVGDHTDVDTGTDTETGTGTEVDRDPQGKDPVGDGGDQGDQVVIPDKSASPSPSVVLTPDANAITPGAQPESDGNGVNTGLAVAAAVAAGGVLAAHGLRVAAKRRRNKLDGEPVEGDELREPDSVDDEEDDEAEEPSTRS